MKINVESFLIGGLIGGALLFNAGKSAGKKESIDAASKEFVAETHRQMYPISYTIHQARQYGDTNVQIEGLERGIDALKRLETYAVGVMSTNNFRSK
jgi:hypothetical protein